MTINFEITGKKIALYVVRSLILFLAIWFSLKYIDNRIICYISAYDQYKSNTGMVEPGDGEPGKLDHSKDDIHS